MTPKEDNPDTPQDERLDRLVRAALDAPVDDLSVARLERFWQDQQREPRRNLSRLSQLAAAALLLAAVGWWVLSPETHPETAKPEGPPAGRPVAEVLPTEQAGRAPTAYEIVAFHAQTARRVRQPRVALDLSQPSPSDRVNELLDRVARPTVDQIAALAPDAPAYIVLLQRLDSATAAGVLTAVLSREDQRPLVLGAVRNLEHPADDLLFVLLDDQDQAVRQWAAVELGNRNGPEIAGRLIAIVTEQNARHREAWLALATCRGSLAQNFLADAARQPRLLGYWNAARVHWSWP